MWSARSGTVRAGSVVAVLGVATVYRAWGFTWGLYNATVSRRPHPDEWAVYWVFRYFRMQEPLNPCPDLATHHCFFDWGGVYLYASYFVHLLLHPAQGGIADVIAGPHGNADFVAAVLAARILSLAASIATVGLVYGLGSRMFGHATGLLAALVAALSGLLVELAHFGTPDSTTMFFLVAALWGLYEALEMPTWQRFALAGVLIGLATASEYHMAILVIPLFVAWWLSPGRRRPPLLIALGAAVLAFMVCNPYAVMEPRQFVFEIQQTLFMRTTGSAAHYQARFSAFDPAIFYVVRYSLGLGVGALIAGWMVSGVLLAVLRRSRADFLLLSWIAPYFLLVTVLPVKFMRYSAPLIPALAILAAACAVAAFANRRRVIRLAAAALGALALLYTGSYDAAYTGLFATADARVEAAAWLERHVPPQTPIEFEVIPNGLTNLPYFVSHGYGPCFSQFKPGSLTRTTTYVAIDTYTFEDHPNIANDRVARFRLSLAQSADYRPVARVHLVPTFLGQSFPIDQSPNDWRYASHDITVYRRMQGAGSSNACFTSVRSAVASLAGNSTASGSATARARQGRPL